MQAKAKVIQHPHHEEEDARFDRVIHELLECIEGQEAQREGLEETPRRVREAWKFWTNGYQQNAADILKTFEDGAENVDEMVLIKDIPVYSHCEHHLAPFMGHAHVAYLPNKRIVGLSKISRLVEMYARRLQVQERLTNQVADAMTEHFTPKGVGVVIECRHMCMESRGVRHVGAATITSALRGAFKEDEKCRAEFMALVRG